MKPVAVQHLGRLRAQRLCTVMQARRQIYEDRGAAEASQLARRYLDLAEQLPFWLLHNGLTHTLDYLAFCASDRAHKQAAADLADDWLHNADSNHEGLHLRDLAGGDHHVDGRLEFRRALRLALGEADDLKLFAQAELARLAKPEPTGSDSAIDDGGDAHVAQ